MAALASHLLTDVGEFADGAPQEDDITIVLVKREAAAHDIVRAHLRLAAGAGRLHQRDFSPGTA